MTKKTQPFLLLAEDDESISDVMKIILEDAGYRIRVARNHEEIRAAVKLEVPRMIFLDVRLGGESGEDIASELLSNSRTSASTLIIVSADDKTEEISRRVGAAGFLSKPFDMDDLLKLCKKHLSE